MQTDVLVVGAGPTGLLLAMDLLRRGVSCRIVDRATGPSTSSRALVLHARTQELLDLRGLRDAMAARAVAVGGMRFRDRGRVLGTVAPPPGSFPSISLPQFATEGVLREALSNAGGSVEWGIAVSGLTPLGRGARAETQQGPIEAAWVVGCDGAHSQVRSAMGIAFAGGALAEAARMADVELDWAGDTDHIGMFFSPCGSMTAVPLGANWWRVVMAGYEPGPAPSLVQMEQDIEARAGFPARIRQVAWTSDFTADCRLASDYRRGRVFLAGDAAHVHSPVGGQGMNTGLQDALNLGWKLAAVIKGAPERLLDSYEQERRPVARAIIRANAQMTRLMVGQSGVPRLMRDHLLPRLLRLPAFTRRMGHAVSGLGIQYGRSPLSVGGGGGPAPHQSGQRRAVWESLPGPAGSVRLIRPDSYLAGSFPSSASAAGYLERWLGSGAGSGSPTARTGSSGCGSPLDGSGIC